MAGGRSSGQMEARDGLKAEVKLQAGVAGGPSQDDVQIWGELHVNGLGKAGG